MSAAGPATAATAPPVRVEPTQLLLRRPVTALAADGPNVAFVFCGQSLGVWKPGATGVTQLDGFAKVGWDCHSSPSLRGPPVGLVTGVALAGEHLAWILVSGGNAPVEYLGLADIGHPAGAALTAHMQHINDPAGVARLGGLLGRGRLLAFSSSLYCGVDPGAPTCPAGTRLPALVRQTVWLVQPDATSSDCVGASGPCRPLASADGPLASLASNGRLVALEKTRALVVVDAAGKTVRTFPKLGAANGAALTATSLVAIVSGRLLEKSIASGRLLHSWPLAHPEKARLLDSRRGLAAYLAAGKLHLLRFSDGRDRVVAAASDGRFGANGLFYTRKVRGAWPGRLTFLPWRVLDARMEGPK